MSAGFQNVHVRVNDAATGKPTPVRIRFVGEDGTYYAPFGRLTEFATGVGKDVGGNLEFAGHKFAYIDGTCEIRLPVGPIEVEIHKGPEYLPVHEAVDLKLGKLSLRLEIRRWTDMRVLGWFSGETHCFDLSPHGAQLEGAAEDLAVVNLLAAVAWVGNQPPGYAESDPRFLMPAITNILAFSGQQPALEWPGHQVVVNTLNFSEFLGDLALLNCHRVVYPLCFGPTSEPTYDWALADLCGQCHRKGGLVIALNQFARSGGDELLADAAQGLIDAFAHPLPWRDTPFLLDSWCDLIDAGLHIPLVAGSGKRSNSDLLGSARTYAYFPPGEELTYKNWIEAVRAGRTFATSGPMLHLQVDGNRPGSRFEVAENTRVRVEVSAQAIQPFHQIDCFFNQRLVMSATASKSGDIWQARSELEFPVQEPGWFYAFCWNPDPYCKSIISAVASPVYLSLPRRPLKPRTDAVRKLLGTLDERSGWVSRSDKFENEQQRQRMADVYLAAKQRLQEKLAEAANT